MGDEEKKGAPDFRPKWFEERIIAAYGKLAKLDKIEKFTKSDPGIKMIQKFCDSEGRCLFIYEAEGEITGSFKAPSDRKKKGVVFVKDDSAAPVALESLGKAVSVTEMHPETMSHLMSIAHDVYFPILTQPGNQEGWPDVIAKELTENLHKFLANALVSPPPPQKKLHQNLASSHFR